MCPLRTTKLALTGCGVPALREVWDCQCTQEIALIVHCGCPKGLCIALQPCQSSERLTRPALRLHNMPGCASLAHGYVCSAACGRARMQPHG